MPINQTQEQADASDELVRLKDQVARLSEAVRTIAHAVHATLNGISEEQYNTCLDFIDGVKTQAAPTADTLSEDAG